MEDLSELGKQYRFPAEWEPHKAVWLAWPNEDDLNTLPIWKTTRRFTIALIENNVNVSLCVVDNDQLSFARNALLERLNKLDKTNLIEKVSFHIVPHTTYWTRDFGPIFVLPRNRSVATAAPKVLSFPWTSWGYKWNTVDYDADGSDSLDGSFSANAAAAAGLDLVQIQGFASEGGDREFNGRDSLIICEDVQLQRNPGMSKAGIEQRYKEIFGVTRFLWMKTGLADDRQIFRGVLKSKTEGTVFGALATGGHVDEYARFVGPSTILLAEVPEEEQDDPIAHASHVAMEENLERLKAALDEDGKPFKIVRIPLPPAMFQTVTPQEPVYDLYKNSLIYEDTPEGKEAKAWVDSNKPLRVIIAASYCNFLITNGVVIAAKYHKAKDPIRSHKKFADADSRAKEILQDLFPDRKIVQIDCFAFNLGGGGFHCTSQQQPL